MIRWSYSQRFVLCVCVLAFLGSATVAVNVAHGVYPPWLAWPGFLLGMPATAGVGILTHETRHAERDDVKIHRLGDRA